MKLTFSNVLVFGPERVSYERSRRMFRTNLRHFSARVFFVKPVLAMEREARSRLEHCRKNVAQLLYSPDEQAQVQQK